MPSNITQLYPKPNISTFTEFFEYSNRVTNHHFMNLGVMGFWIVAFVALSGYTEPKNAFAASSFISMVLSFIFFTVGLINEYIVLITTIGTALAAFYLFKSSST